MSEEDPFLRCQNCGRLVPKKEGFGQWFCSRDCALQYQRCPVCGRFFEKNKGVGDFCSAACAAPLPEEYKKKSWKT